MAKVLTKRVAVVGAGAAGLATGKFLRDAGMHIDIFERAPALGGIWRYDQPENTNRVLYQGLKTNLPKEIMQYFSLPFDDSLPSFITAKDMLTYLENYAVEFDLNHLIQYNRTITSIVPLVGASIRWRVKHTDTQTHKKNAAAAAADDASELSATMMESEVSVEEYDFVVVANGHYDEPNMPTEAEVCEGFDQFPNKVMHSHDYDDPEQFKDKTVILIGSGASGADLAREIAQVGGKAIVVVDRHWKCTNEEGSNMPLVEIGGEFNNIYRCQTLDRITNDGFVYLNGVHRVENGQWEQFKIHADAILFCTGYNYHFPFLDVDMSINPGIHTSSIDEKREPLLHCYNRRVHPLYLQLFHAKYPSLAFVGIPYLIVPFPFFEIQARLLAAVFNATDSSVSQGVSVIGFMSIMCATRSNPSLIDLFFFVHPLFKLLMQSETLCVRCCCYCCCYCLTSCCLLLKKCCPMKSSAWHGLRASTSNKDPYARPID
jgi:thioredoxin reductase